MLSSAIPKRLVVSFVLVGLVSLFMTSFAGLASERVSAQATGTDLKGLNFGSTITVQAPLTPWSHPKWVPVRSSFSRRQSASVIRASAVNSRSVSLTVN